MGSWKFDFPVSLHVFCRSGELAVLAKIFYVGGAVKSAFHSESVEPAVGFKCDPGLRKTTAVSTSLAHSYVCSDPVCGVHREDLTM